MESLSLQCTFALGQVYKAHSALNLLLCLTQTSRKQIYTEHTTHYRDYCVITEWSDSNDENFILVWEYFTAALITGYAKQQTVTDN